MEKPELLSGTLDLMILRVLNPEPLHGFGVAERIHVLSRDVLTVEEGSLYPALYRLVEKGWIKAEWGMSENNRRARFYSITTAGRKQLDAEAANWRQVSNAINLILKGI